MRRMILLGLISIVISSCQTMGGGAGGSEGKPGSSPINSKEEVAYKRALLKCYKTGGSRIVKIEGKLRCY